MPQINSVNTADHEPYTIRGGSHEGEDGVELPGVTRAMTIDRHARAHDSSDTVREESFLTGSPSADLEEGNVTETSGDLNEGTADPRRPEINIGDDAPSRLEVEAILNEIFAPTHPAQFASSLEDEFVPKATEKNDETVQARGSVSSGDNGAGVVQDNVASIADLPDPSFDEAGSANEPAVAAGEGDPEEDLQEIAQPHDLHLDQPSVTLPTIRSNPQSMLPRASSTSGRRSIPVISRDLEERTADLRWRETNIDDEAPSPLDADAILKDDVDEKRSANKIYLPDDDIEAPSHPAQFAASLEDEFGSNDNKRPQFVEDIDDIEVPTHPAELATSLEHKFASKITDVSFPFGGLADNVSSLVDVPDPSLDEAGNADQPAAAAGEGDLEEDLQGIVQPHDLHLERPAATLPTIRSTPQSMLPRASSASGRRSVPVIEAWPVQRGSDISVYNAVHVEEVGWIKNHQKHIIIGLLFILVGTALALGVPLGLGSNKSDDAVKIVTSIPPLTTSVSPSTTFNPTISGVLSSSPTNPPSSSSSFQPSDEPSFHPSDKPSSQPSAEPSFHLSDKPSSQPSAEPSSQPSDEPSIQLSDKPSSQPSDKPSFQPSDKPSFQSSDKPSIQPSDKPSSYTQRCFTDRAELKDAVDAYTAEGLSCSEENECEVTQEYGWPIGTWCVSYVTSMHDLFRGKGSFNDDISMWNTSKVTTMRSMFYEAIVFNSNISNWDTSSVLDMAFMFRQASIFDGNLSSWNTTMVTTMESIFDQAIVFNNDISKWDTSFVLDMSYMFHGASTFNGNLSLWNTMKVTTMEGMFYEATIFNKDISNWDTSSVLDMSDMFYGASAFNGNLSLWNTSKVTTMESIFDQAIVFNSDTSNWDTSSVLDMSYMFFRASTFNGNLSLWNTTKVTTMESMFDQAILFNSDISNWDTSSVLDMSYMFFRASTFDGNLSLWNTTKVTTMERMFFQASAFNSVISNWDTSSVLDMSFMFYGASVFNSNVSNWDTSSVTDMSSMF